MSPRGRPPTQRDVALEAGVSTATVSYILSGRRGRANPVTEETRQRVLDVANALGYQRNHAARSLRRRRTDSVCLVHRPPSNPWLERLIDQLHRAALEHGYSVITMPVGPDDESGNAMRVLREQYVDGAILTTGHRLSHDELGRLAGHGLALVVFDEDMAPDGFDVVRQDQSRACRAAVEHIVSRGRRRIAYLGHGTPDGPVDDDVMYRSYRAVLERHGLAFDPSLVVAAADHRPIAHLATKALLERPDPPDALFSASDRGGIAAVWAAQTCGVAVPDDLAVVAVGNTDEGEVITPALTSVGIPAFDFAVVVDRLFERLTTRDPLPGVELHQPWRLIVRRSA